MSEEPCRREYPHAAHTYMTSSDLLTRLHTCAGIKRPPQTWSLPPEPGPEVQAVRGTYQADGKEPVSVLLISEFNGGAWMGPAMGYPELGGCFPYSWGAALAKFGQLTDATGELDAQDS